ncbi:hypothetical protein [Paenibacillus bovis]|uniref:Uncharacterized protein n=1 Tax=Paenibacillus bovis TaxID=1616788 RepID=A0A172ZFB7_9BACL|nr:hypothetical protein [Paenibacillus bovis]ANF95967.1 hypothetical protein AR543_08075 [Paenibacillus bovis]
MRTSIKWLPALLGSLLAGSLIAGCSDSGRLVDSSEHAKGYSASIESVQIIQPHRTSVKVTPASEIGDSIRPEQLADALLQGNYELVYAQTSPMFKREVSWQAFVDTVQSLNSRVDHYVPVAEQHYQNSLRKVWVDEHNDRQITALFAENHADYPDHTILNMKIQQLHIH